MAAVEQQELDQQPEALTIEEFLEQEATKELLRFSTAGSVDDGKSTLIGRLLYDARGIYEDQLSSIQNSKVNRSSGPIDFSLLTDGLRAEREQGITIDVAYRYFATPKRKFIIADTPGHEQYTRNMATGASTAQLAIVLVDARHGVLPQTRRHAAISALLGIPNLVLAVNKMDLKEYSQQVFDNIVADFLAFAADFGFSAIQAIPMSALEGENVARRGTAMPWYTGPYLLEYLETVPVMRDLASKPLRFPVQYVIRPDQYFRGYAGQLASGRVSVGDEVEILPSGRKSRIASISTFDGLLDTAQAPLSVVLTLEDERDVSRGDMLVHPSALPQIARQVKAHLVWMTDAPVSPGRNLLLKQTTRQVSVRLQAIESKLDIQQMSQQPGEQLALNDIGIVRLDVSQALYFDPYKENRLTGAFILIDPLTNGTVGAGMILEAVVNKGKFEPLTTSERYARNGHQPAILVVREEDLARRLERRLFDHNCQAIAMDPGAATDALLAAGLLLIVAESADPRAVRLDELELPKDADAALDAILSHLEQRGVLLSDRFNSGDGI